MYGTRKYSLLGEFITVAGLAFAIIMMIVSGLDSPNEIIIGGRPDWTRWITVAILTLVFFVLLVGLIRHVFGI